METNIKKCKKRKTRRYLNELRQKIYQPNDLKIKNNNAKQCFLNKTSFSKNNYITENRLTLFNKIVRSETITRAPLSELEVKKAALTREANFANVSLKECNNTKTITKTENKKNSEGSEIENISPNVKDNELCNEVSTPKSVILFSSQSQYKENICSIAYSQSLKSSSSPSTSDINIYDQIINNIKKKYPHIRKEMNATIKKYNADLFNLIDHSCMDFESHIGDTKFSYQYSSPDKQNFSPNVLSIQDPNAYTGCLYSQCSNESKTSEIQVTSPPESSSSSINMSPSTPLASGVNDTPEYYFYPHRLN